MSRSPEQGEVLRGLRSLTSKKVILTAVLIVAVLAFSGIMMMNGSEDSEAANYADTVWVDGREIPGDGSTVSLGIYKANVRYYSSSGELYIKGLSSEEEIPFDTYYFEDNNLEKGFAAIYSTGDLIIIASDLKTIDVSTYQGEDLESLMPGQVYGVRCLGDLTIRGSLSIKVCDAVNNSFGVISKHSLTVTGTLGAYGGSRLPTENSDRTSFFSKGVEAYDFVLQPGSQLTGYAADIEHCPKCGNGGLVKSIGIHGHTMKSSYAVGNGGTVVYAKGGNIDTTPYQNFAYPVVSAGIYMENGMTLEGTTIRQAEGGDIYFDHDSDKVSIHGGGSSYGVYCRGLMNLDICNFQNIKGGIVYLPTPCAYAESYGIWASSYVGVSSDIEATGSDASRKSYGMIVFGDMTVGENYEDGSDITCVSGMTYSTDGVSYGLECDNLKATGNAKITGRAGGSCYVMSAGVSVETVTFTEKAKLTGYGGEGQHEYISATRFKDKPFLVEVGSSADSYGIYINGSNPNLPRDPPYSVSISSNARIEGYGGKVVTWPTMNGFKNSAGIFLGPYHDHLITGTGTIVAEGGETKYGHYYHSDDSFGIMSRERPVVIDGVRIIATGGTVGTGYPGFGNEYTMGCRTVGIYVQALTIQNGADVTATGGDNINYCDRVTNQSYKPKYNDSVGLHVFRNDLTVNNSTLRAGCGDSSLTVGIWVMGNFTVTGENSMIYSEIGANHTGGLYSGDGLVKGSYGIFMQKISTESNDDIVIGPISLFLVKGQTKAIACSTYNQTTFNNENNTITMPGGVRSRYWDGSSSTTMPSDPISYYDLWNCKYLLYVTDTLRFDVSFNANGGSLPSGDDGGFYRFGEPMTYRAFGPFKVPEVASYHVSSNSKELLGWALTSDGEKVCDNGGYINISRDTVLYAVWVDHDLVHYPEVVPACGEWGNHEYWKCANCGQTFHDANGTNDTKPWEMGWYDWRGYHDHEIEYNWSPDGHSCVVVFTCTICGDVHEETVASSVKSTVPATCTAMGKTTYSVEGTYYYNEEYSAFNTDYGDTKVVEDIPMIAHTEDDEHDIVTPPTCTEGGYTTHTCSVCGQTFVDAYTDAAGHTWGNWIVITPATDDSEGEESHECSLCHVEEFRPIPKLHSHNIVHVDANAPTCTEAGNIEHYMCSECGRFFSDSEGNNEIYVVEIPAAHDLIHHDAQAPTCTSVGWDAYDECRNCDYTTYHELPVTDHVLVHHAAKAATCTEPGWGAYDTCWNCDYTTKVEIPATGHHLVATFGWEDDGVSITCPVIHLVCDHDGCTFTYDIADGIQIITAVKIAPTCSVPGTTTYTATATYLDVEYTGSYDAQDIALMPHTTTDVITAPTCTEQGYTTHTCTVCGEIYADTFVDALTHDLHDHEDKEATCTEYGWTGYRTCEREGCGYYERVEIEPLGHDLTHFDAVEFGCTTPGNIEYWHCSVCDKYYADMNATIEITLADIVIPAHHVTEHTARVEVTCTADGNVEYWHCSVCGNNYSDEACANQITTIVIPAQGHDMICHPEKEATCTDAGNDLYYYCERCQKYFEDEDGVTETTLDAVTHAALGHDYEHHAAQAPSCTEHGWGDYDVCTRCGYSSYQEIAALGHAFSATYDWSVDGKTCTVHIVCANDSAHNHDIAATVSSSEYSPATFSAMGVTEYSVSGTYEGFSYSSSKKVADIAYTPKEENGVKTYEEAVAANAATNVTAVFDKAKEDNGNVEFAFGTGSSSMTISFDSDAVGAIGGNNVSITAAIVKNSQDVPDAELVMNISLEGATFSEGKAKVTVPFSQAVPEGKVLKVYFINGDKREDMNATLVGDKVVFETNHFSTYAVVFEDAPSSGGNGGEFPIWIIFVIIAVVAVGGGVFFFISKKKA